MTRRKIVLLVSLLIISLLIAASFMASNETVKIVLFLIIVIMAAALIVAYIFQGWADQATLRSELDQLRRDFEVERALAESRTGRIAAGLQRLKREMYTELARRSMGLDDPTFVDAMDQFLADSAKAMEGRDG